MNPELYEQNKRAVEKHHPHLLEFLQEEPTPGRCQVLQAKTGAYRLAVTKTDGSLATIHNADDPEAVAERTAGRMIGESNRVIVLMGLGLGYLARSVVRKLRKGSAVILYEADPDVFRYALRLVNLVEVLEHPRAKVFVGEDVRLEPYCYQYMLETGGEVHIVQYEPAFQLSPEVYTRKTNQELARFASGARINLATATRFGPIFTKCILEAMPHIIEAHGVGRLKNLFVGLPAMIVAAGPSLEKNCEQLRDLKGRAIIIAADTVLGYLLARGIKPDFVTSVDPQEETTWKYQGVAIPDDVALVFHPSCHDWIVKHFPGPKFVTETSMTAYQWLKEYFPDKGNIEGDIQCQVHMSFNLAQLMGCNPIVLMGLDLCYTGDLVHVKGGSYFLDGTAEPWMDQRGRWTKNIFGEPVRADPLFFSYRNTWENKIRHHEGRVINATEGGLNIAGSDYWLLRDVVDKFCPDDPVDVQACLNLAMRSHEQPDWGGLLAEVRDRIRDLSKLLKAAKTLCRLLDQLAEMRQQGEGATPALERVSHRAERMTNLIPQYAKTLALLQLIDFELEMFMCREETDTIDAIPDELERLDQQITRGRRYYGDLSRAIPILHRHLVRLHGRLQALHNLEERGAQTDDWKAMLSRTQKYVALERFDRAKSCFMQCVAQRGVHDCDDKILAMGIQVGLGQSDPKMARDYAQHLRARTRLTRNLESLVLDAEANWERWEKRLADVRDAACKEGKALFYGGDFYFRLRNYPFAEMHYRRVAHRTDLSDEQRAEAFFRLSQTYLAMGDDEKRMSALEQSLLLNPADPRIYYDLGALALNNGNTEVAGRFFVKGAEVSLEDPDYCEAVGALYCAAGVPGLAIPFYERALVGVPNRPELLRQISQAYQSVFSVIPSA